MHTGVPFYNPIQAWQGHDPSRPPQPDSHLLKSLSLSLSIKTSSTSNCPPTSWMLSEEPLSMTWSTVPLYWITLRWWPDFFWLVPKDHPTLLGCPEWAVHRGWYSPEGRSCLHPSRAPWQNSCWLPQCSPGIEKNTSPSPRSSLLARHRFWHTDYVKRCAIWTQHKASLPSQSMPPETSPAACGRK